MSTEFRFRPSQSSTWSKCPGSIRSVETLPEEQRNRSGKAAADGRKAHKAIEAMLEDKPLPEDINLEPDLLAACQDCAIAVTQRQLELERAGYQVQLHLEASVIYNEHCGGTADVVLLGLNAHGQLAHVEIIDHKLGYAIWVPEDSLQLQIYLIAAIKTLTAMTMYDVMRSSISYHTTVIQPRHPDAQRLGPCRTKLWTANEIYEMEARINTYILQAMNADAVRVPSEAACRFCAYKAHCPELSQKALEEATQVFTEGEDMLHESHYVRAPDELSIETQDRLKQAIPLIRAWLNAVEDHMHTSMLAGTEYPNFKLVYGRGSRAWANEEEAIAQFAKTNRDKDHGGGRLKQDDYFERSLLSPAQAEKRIKPLLGKRAWNKLESMISKSKGKPVIAPRSDHREEIITNPARIFEPVPAPPQNGDNETSQTENDNPLNLSILE